MSTEAAPATAAAAAPAVAATTAPAAKEDKAEKVKKGKGGKKQQQQKVLLKKGIQKFNIDCSEPAADEIFDIASFEKFLHDRIKVGGKTGVLGENVTISREGNTINVTSKIAFSKRYLKYLTKKFLKKQLLRDYIRVIARTKSGYFLRYFNFHNEEEEAEE